MKPLCGSGLKDSSGQQKQEPLFGTKAHGHWCALNCKTSAIYSEALERFEWEKRRLERSDRVKQQRHSEKTCEGVGFSFSAALSSQLSHTDPCDEAASLSGLLKKVVFIKWSSHLKSQCDGFMKLGDSATSHPDRPEQAAPLNINLPLIVCAGRTDREEMWGYLTPLRHEFIESLTSLSVNNHIKSLKEKTHRAAEAGAADEVKLEARRCRDGWWGERLKETRLTTNLLWQQK